MDEEMINGITLSSVSECYEDTRKASMLLQCMNLGKDFTSVCLSIALKRKCCFQFWCSLLESHGTELKTHKHERIKRLYCPASQEETYEDAESEQDL